MTELRALTAARGVAAWLVVLYHIRLSIAGLPAPLVATLGKGYLAVDFFFLLSGFVIGYAYDDRWGKMTIGKFFKVPAPASASSTSSSCISHRGVRCPKSCPSACSLE